MYVNVLLLNGFDKSLTYHVPEHLVADIKTGSVVRVPLQRRFEAALVQKIIPVLSEKLPFAVRDVHSFEEFPNDKLFHDFVTRVARYYCTDELGIYHRIRHFLDQKESDLSHGELPSCHPGQGPGIHLITLTDEQQQIVDYVLPYVVTPSYQPVLVHGVTGSGKTEVYKKLIQEAFAQGKSTVLLLPEVTLALQFEHLLSEQLPTIPIRGFHSASSPTSKKDVWNALVHGIPLVVVGVHLPVLLPIEKLGLIIVDEEHEQGFGEKKHPRLNSKTIALMRAHQYKIPIVLGSATPSVQSLYNAQKYGWKQFVITKRFAGAFPTLQKVVLTTEGQKRRKHFWVSAQLEAAIKECFAKKEQVIIFINRRGYSFFVQCKTCGHVFCCTDCSVSLTLHVAQSSELRCHYCGYATPLPTECPTCKAPERSLLKKGIGTQQAVQIFQEIFPQAVIERADLDSTTKKRSWAQTVERFKSGDINMLIGTQTITKGYHFPNVSLVGVLWGDLNLHFPVFNAREVALQQLIQVAGRAGRQRAGGKVIVQVMRDSAVFDYVDEQRYIEFAHKELADRQASNYPPYVRLATLEIRHAQEKQVDADAQKIADVLYALEEKGELGVTILGPAHPAVHRIERYELRQILIKAPTVHALQIVVLHAQRVDVKSDVFVVMG